MPLTLLRQSSPLSDPAEQRRLLEALPVETHPVFADMVGGCGRERLTAAAPQVLQVNVGKVCNQTCRHCHVDAGPDRRESLSRETAELCIDVLRRTDIGTLDITGGAPEMNPHFRYLVAAARNLGRHVIDRCNLTILQAPGYEDLPEFLADHNVEVVASLPCYLEVNTDRQRGDGVFQKSIAALRRLNELGYGRAGNPNGGWAESSRLTSACSTDVVGLEDSAHSPKTPKTLSLVYNPVGPSLPPPQEALEAAYRRELRDRYGIEFSRLYTITNLPISRFLDDLMNQGRLAEYMTKLVQSFNPLTIDGLMCRTTISVDWTGRLYDCDFNQMLDLPVMDSVPRHLRDWDVTRFAGRAIATGRHCYGCTAGAGSSCQGRIVAPVSGSPVAG